MSEAITPEQLPRWVPGDLTVDSAALGWEGMALRGYRYAPSDVPVPPMRDYMIVAYREGVTPMARQCGSRWSSERVAPGQVSLLTHRVDSHWRWTQGIEVLHLYLSPDHMARVGSEVFDREVAQVQLRDVLKADDRRLSNLVWNLAAEVRGPGLGGRLYADAVLNQACVHILRNYAEVAFRLPGSGGGGLSSTQKRRLLEYIHAHLDRNISLAQLAAVAGLSRYCFARRFRDAFGVPPHEFVMRQRIEQARHLLARGDLALKAVAAHCGFSDQSHMTRLFRRVLGVTPGQFREKTSS